MEGSGGSPSFLHKNIPGPAVRVHHTGPGIFLFFRLPGLKVGPAFAFDNHTFSPVAVRRTCLITFQFVQYCQLIRLHICVEGTSSEKVCSHRCSDEDEYDSKDKLCIHIAFHIPEVEEGAGHHHHDTKCRALGGGMEPRIHIGQADDSNRSDKAEESTAEYEECDNATHHCFYHIGRSRRSPGILRMHW